MLSSACLRDSTASVHIFSAEQEQLRGKKCLVVLVGQKEGHMILYGQRETKKWTEKKKNRVWKKIIVIGYAYLSQGKHITTELTWLLKPGYKGVNQSIDKKKEKKRWKTSLVNRRGQIRGEKKRSVWMKWDSVFVNRTKMEAITRWMDGLTARMNLYYFHSVNVSSALLPLIGVPPGWIIWMQIRLERRSISTSR